MPKKTKYKYIHFEENLDDNTWWCVNTKANEYIGLVDYYKPWGQYCFYPERVTVFSQNCLKDIIDFMKRLAEEE